MALKFNRVTAVPRDFKTQEDIYTEFLNQENIVGRSENIQTEKFNYHFTSTSSYTLEYDIILTAISITVTNNSIMTAYIGSAVPANVVGYCDCQAGESAQNFIDIPNWYLPAGAVIRAVESGTGSITFIGYHA